MITKQTRVFLVFWCKGTFVTKLLVGIIWSIFCSSLFTFMKTMAQKSDFLPLQLAQLLHLVSILQTSHRAMTDNKIEKQCNNIGKSWPYGILHTMHLNI